MHQERLKEVMTRFKNKRAILRSSLTASAKAMAIGLALGLLAACGGGSAVPTVTKAAIDPSYVKVCNNGENEGVGSCPKNPALGSKPEAWGCTSDTRTGLMWEVKTPTVFGSTNNLRDAALLYSNYDSTTSPQFFQGGSGGGNGSYVNPTQGTLDQPTNALGFAKQVNELPGSAALCGTSRWRLPSQTELESLLDLKVVSIPGTLQTPPVTRAAINQDYFPNTNPSEPYASSTPIASDAVYKPLEYFTNNVSFKTFNQTIADQLQSYARGGNKRAAVRLVADCKCKPAGDTQAVRNWGKSVLLPNKEVLTVGGGWMISPLFGSFGEIFNPVTEQWSNTGQFLPSEILNLPVERHSVTLVGTKVVVVGGINLVSTKNVYIFDTVLKTWSKGQGTTFVHSAHGAVAVGSNKLLVLGGNCDIGTSVACDSGTVEEYDISANTWTLRSIMPVSVHSASTTVLADGRILMAGGTDNASALSVVQIYNPATNTWARGISPMIESRYYHTATLLADGRILVTGGNKVLTGNGSVATPLKTAEIYNPATNVWTQVASMSIERVLHSATALPDGRVLVAGGSGIGSTNSSANSVTATVEIFDPQTGLWTPACSLINPRYAHNATLLADGARILISGGGTQAGAVAKTEIYTP